MSRRRFLVATVVLLAVVTVSEAVYLCMPHPTINRDRLKRVEMGMSRGEVSAIIGAPPGDYTTREHLPLHDAIEDSTGEEWASDEGAILVRFDETGRAVRAYYTEVVLLSEPRKRRGTWDVFERMRTWIGL